MFISKAAHAASCLRSVSEPVASPRLLDSLRGLAALMVVFTHVFSMAPPLPRVIEWADFTPLHAVHTGRAPVLFFFVLSGYVLTLSLLRPNPPGLLGFALRRSLRLLPPVAAAVLLSGVLRTAFDHGRIFTEGWDLRNFWAEPLGLPMMLRQMLLIGGDGSFTLDIPLWSLVHEWRLSLLFPLVLLFRRRPLLLLGLGFAVALLSVALGVAPDRHQLGPRFLSTFLAAGYFAFTFAAGAALAFAGPRFELRGWARAAAWGVVVLGCTLPYDLVTVAGAVLLIVLARGPGRLPQVLAWPPLRGLGRISFSLYLIHVPVLAAALHATYRLLPPDPVLAVAVPLAVAAAAGFYFLVEAPSHRLSQRLGTRLLPAPAGDAGLAITAFGERWLTAGGALLRGSRSAGPAR